MKTRITTSKSIAIGAIGTILGLVSLAYFFIPSTTSTTIKPAAATEATAQAAWGKLPLSFESNKGQTASHVKFLARGAGYTLFLSGSEAVLSLRGDDKETKRQGNKETKGIRNPQSAIRNPQSSVLRMKLAGANPSAQAVGLDELPGKSNYFIGNDPKRWRTDIPTYAKAKFAAVYPGVDVVYYGAEGRQLEYDFVVAPQADPKAIKLRFEGADKIEVDKQGDLALSLNGKELRLRRPVIYQEKDGAKQEIAGGYKLTGKREIGFEIPAYDATRPLVIDPVLAYSTYLGGSGQDNGVGIAVSAHGDAFITGLTTSPDFPTEPNGSKFGLGGNVDAFVSKLDASGTHLVYSTYLGGSNDENLYSTFDTYSGIAVNSAGNAFVTGLTTSPDVPTPGGMQSSYGGGSADAYVTELNPTGNALVYSTFLGGDGWEGGHSIAVDAADNAYVTGAVLPGNKPIKSTTSNGDPKGAYDGFVAVLDFSSNLKFFSYLGGSGWDLADGVALDAQNSFYVVGWGNSDDLNPTANAYQDKLKGGADIYIWKFRALITGGTLEYRSYLGGETKSCSANPPDAERTVNHGIAVEAQGNVIYVTGQTDSTDFPGSPGSLNGCLTGFVAKLDIKLQPNNQLVYSKFLGGGSGGAGRAIAVDINGNAYVTGVSSGAFQSTSGLPTCSDTGAFVVKLDAYGAVKYAACLSGVGEEVGYDVAVDPAGCAYVTGYTQSVDFPTVNPFQPSFAGGLGGQPQDGFVTKICSGLDHFKCYDVQAQENFHPFNVILRDQFELQEVTVLRPTTLCNPAIKCVPTGNPAKPYDCSQRLNPDDHLVCYETTDERGTPQFEQREVIVSNQFGKQQPLTVFRRKNLLCVPSLKAHVDAKH